MKKILAFLLCCVLTVSLFAACGADDGAPPPFAAADETNAVSEETDAAADETNAAAEAAEDSGINYKGLFSRKVTLEDVKAVEGRDPDFDFAAGDTTYYVYNDVSMDGMTFSQVQFSFGEDSVRVSCTASADEGPSAIIESWKTALTTSYGEPSDSNGTFTWQDGSGNYLMLCALNDTTAQLAFYLCRE